jgi:hypothetical protein
MRWRSAAMAGLSEEAIERLKKAALNGRIKAIMDCLGVLVANTYSTRRVVFPLF